MDNLLSDMDRVYNGLQKLQLQPTKTNTAIILDTLQVLENAYAYVSDVEAQKEHEAVLKEVPTDGNTDSE